MNRKIIKIIDCSEINLHPQEAIQEIKIAFIEKGIGFAGIFYEVKSMQGYVWVNSIPLEVA